jgi:hypothetical protein
VDIILKPNEFGSTTPKPVSTGLKPPACDFNHRCQNTTSMVTIHSIRKYTHPKPEPSSNPHHGLKSASAILKPNEFGSTTPKPV